MLDISEFYDETQGWCRTCASRRNNIVSLAERIVGSRKAWRALTREERLEVKATAGRMYDLGADFAVAERAEKSVTEGFVYVIINPAWEDYCKIGRAFDPESRLRGYQTSSPFRDFALYGARYFKDAAQAEAEMHLRLSFLREEGEWFYMDPADALVEIDKLQEQLF